MKMSEGTEMNWNILLQILFYFAMGRWIDGNYGGTDTAVSWDLFYKHGLYEIMAWLSDYIHSFLHGVITQPCPYLNGGLDKLPLKFEVRVWTSNYKSVFMCCNY